MIFIEYICLIVQKNKYIAWPKRSRHLDLTNQIGTSQLMDDYCMGDFLSTCSKLFNTNLCTELLLKENI